MRSSAQPGAPRTAAGAPCCGEEHLEHCHGTSVVHGDHAECTDPSCVSPVEAHGLTVPCADVTPGCDCRAVS